MNRIFLLAVASIILAAPAFGQIALPESVAAGKIGEAKSTVSVPEGARVKRKWSVSDPRVDLKVPGDGEIVYYTSRVDLECTLTQTIVIATEDDLKMEDFTEKLVIGKPAPETPDKPEPPKPKTLRQMTSVKSADILADNYSDLAEMFASNTDTPAQFEYVHKAMRTSSPIMRDLKDVTEVYAAIDASLAKAIKIDPWKDSVLVVLEDVVDQLSGDDPVVVDPPVVTPKATSATLVFEKNDGFPLPAVRAAINQLNREKNIPVTEFEDDTVDGDGDVPDQYKAPLDAARKAGMPAFVVMAGDKVLVVIKNPKAEQILEAVK